MARAWRPIHAGALRRWPSHVVLRRIPQHTSRTQKKKTPTFVAENLNTTSKLSTSYTNTKGIKRVHKAKNSHLANSRPCHPCPFRRRRPVVRWPRGPGWPSPVSWGRRSAPAIAVAAAAAPPSSMRMTSGGWWFVVPKYIEH